MTARRPGHELPSNPRLLTLKYEHSQLAATDSHSDTLEHWTVTVHEMGDGDEGGPQVGELALYRLRADTGQSRLMVADGESGEMLSIAEAVLDGGQYSADFENAVESPFGDLLILDKVFLEKPYRGFGLGPILAAEAVRRLEGGCCAVAAEPGASEWPEDESLLTEEYNAEATRKIAALWESLGFRHFKDGVYLRDTALDYSDILRQRRKELAVLGDEHRGARQQ
nr:hypothetical protein KPHV_86600 [Kitasatospora purpeofusca]